MGETFFKDVIKKYTKDSTIKITPHVFRHTRAVHLLDNGVQLIYIKELLGHSSVITIEEYAKVIEKRKTKAIEKASPNFNDDLEDWNNDQDLLSQLLNL